MVLNFTLFQICLVALMAVAVAVARPQNDLPLDANGEPFDVSNSIMLGNFSCYCIHNYNSFFP